MATQKEKIDADIKKAKDAQRAALGEDAPPEKPDYFVTGFEAPKTKTKAEEKQEFIENVRSFGPLAQVLTYETVTKIWVLMFIDSLLLYCDQPNRVIQFQTIPQRALSSACRARCVVPSLVAARCAYHNPSAWL